MSANAANRDTGIRHRPDERPPAAPETSHERR